MRSRVDGGQRRLDAGARQFEVGEHLGRAVLQRLEGADHLAELHAGLQVVERGLEGLRRGAEHLGGEAGAGAVEHLVQHRSACLRRQARLGGDVLEGQVRHAAAVGAVQALARETFGVAAHQEQRHAVAGVAPRR